MTFFEWPRWSTLCHDTFPCIENSAFSLSLSLSLSLAVRQSSLTVNAWEQQWRKKNILCPSLPPTHAPSTLLRHMTQKSAYGRETKMLRWAGRIRFWPLWRNVALMRKMSSFSARRSSFICRSFQVFFFPFLLWSLLFRPPVTILWQNSKVNYECKHTANDKTNLSF